LPPEIRFPRKPLGLSGIDLAMHLWNDARVGLPLGERSNGDGCHGDRLLRLMVIVAEGAGYSLNALRAVALDAPKATPIHIRRRADTWEAWIGDLPE